MKNKYSDNEGVKVVIAAIGPLVAIILMFAVTTYESVTGISLAEYGMYPLKLEGLLGVLTMPFLHENWSHLWSNTLPFLIIGTAICYYYKQTAGYIFLFFLIFTGVFTWLIGRESYHIGASGIVYAMSFFILVSAIIKKERRLMSFALLVIFLYGSIIWGFFPEFFPDKNISWEGHLAGALSGIIAAFMFSDKGPQKTIYKWEEEDNIDDEMETENINTDENPEEKSKSDVFTFQNHT